MRLSSITGMRWFIRYLARFKMDVGVNGLTIKLSRHKQHQRLQNAAETLSFANSKTVSLAVV